MKKYSVKKNKVMKKIFSLIMLLSLVLANLQAINTINAFAEETGDEKYLDEYEWKTPLPGIKIKDLKIKDLSVGPNIVALAENGDLYSWGWHYNLGNWEVGDSTYYLETPKKIMSNVKEIYDSPNGGLCWLFLTNSDELYAWDLGDMLDHWETSKETYWSPKKIFSGISSFDQIIGADYIIDNNNTLYSFDMDGKTEKIFENVKEFYDDNYILTNSGDLYHKYMADQAYEKEASDVSEYIYSFGHFSEYSVLLLTDGRLVVDQYFRWNKTINDAVKYAYFFEKKLYYETKQGVIHKVSLYEDEDDTSGDDIIVSEDTVLVDWPHGNGKVYNGYTENDATYFITDDKQCYLYDEEMEKMQLVTDQWIDTIGQYTRSSDGKIYYVDSAGESKTNKYSDEMIALVAENVQDFLCLGSGMVGVVENNCLYMWSDVQPSDGAEGASDWVSYLNHVRLDGMDKKNIIEGIDRAWYCNPVDFTSENGKLKIIPVNRPDIQMAVSDNSGELKMLVYKHIGEDEEVSPEPAAPVDSILPASKMPADPSLTISPAPASQPPSFSPAPISPAPSSSLKPDDSVPSESPVNFGKDEFQFSEEAPYQINDTGMLTGITFRQNTVEDIISQFTNENLVCKDETGRILADTDTLMTGATINAVEGTQTKATCTIVIAGDVFGDGALNLKDVTMTAQYCLNKRTLTVAQLAAADVVEDGAVNLKDVTMLARCNLNKTTLPSQKNTNIQVSSSPAASGGLEAKATPGSEPTTGTTPATQPTAGTTPELEPSPGTEPTPAGQSTPKATETSGAPTATPRLVPAQSIEETWTDTEKRDITDMFSVSYDSSSSSRNVKLISAIEQNGILLMKYKNTGNSMQSLSLEYSFTDQDGEEVAAWSEGLPALGSGREMVSFWNKKYGEREELLRVKDFNVTISSSVSEDKDMASDLSYKLVSGTDEKKYLQIENTSHTEDIVAADFLIIGYNEAGNMVDLTSIHMQNLGLGNSGYRNINCDGKEYEIILEEAYANSNKVAIDPTVRKDILIKRMNEVKIYRDYLRNPEDYTEEEIREMEKDAFYEITNNNEESLYFYITEVVKDENGKIITVRENGYYELDSGRSLITGMLDDQEQNVERMINIVTVGDEGLIQMDDSYLKVLDIKQAVYREEGEADEPYISCKLEINNKIFHGHIQLVYYVDGKIAGCSQSKVFYGKDVTYDDLIQTNENSVVKEVGFGLPIEDMDMTYEVKINSLSALGLD